MFLLKKALEIIALRIKMQCKRFYNEYALEMIFR